MIKECRKLTEQTALRAWLTEWRNQLMNRRRFLVQLAGGAAASLLPVAGLRAEQAVTLDETARWRVLDAVQQHLLPSEPDAPGARELKTLDYLRFIVADDSQDQEERTFVLQGAEWLEGVARQVKQASFAELGEADREQVLRRVEASAAGSNWLSTMLLYLIEAILSDPAYGGNAGGAGWRWLAHIPGFPSPPVDKLYPELLKR